MSQHYEIERFRDEDGSWLEVGAFDDAAEYSYPESAFERWMEHQGHDGMLPGRYRIIEHKSYGATFVEMDVTEKRELVAERVKRVEPVEEPVEA